MANRQVISLAQPTGRPLTGILQIELPYNASIKIRACMVEGELWFVVQDVFSALGMVWTGRPQLRTIPEYWQTTRRCHTLTSVDEFILINEPAVYKIAFHFNNACAESLTQWVAQTVVEVRKHGEADYLLKLQPVIPFITQEQYNYLAHKVASIDELFWYRKSAHHHAWRVICEASEAQKPEEIPKANFDRAVAEAERLILRAEHFFKVKCQFEKRAIDWVFNKNTLCSHDEEIVKISEGL